MPHAPLAKGKKTHLPGPEIGKHPWQMAKSVDSQGRLARKHPWQTIKKRICQGQEP